MQVIALAGIVSAVDVDFTAQANSTERLLQTALPVAAYEIMHEHGHFEVDSALDWLEGVFKLRFGSFNIE